jgi:hypothetical protein
MAGQQDEAFSDHENPSGGGTNDGDFGADGQSRSTEHSSKKKKKRRKVLRFFGAPLIFVARRVKKKPKKRQNETGTVEPSPAGGRDPNEPAPEQRMSGEQRALAALGIVGATDASLSSRGALQRQEGESRQIVSTDYMAY